MLGLSVTHVPSRTAWQIPPCEFAEPGPNTGFSYLELPGANRPERLLRKHVPAERARTGLPAIPTCALQKSNIPLGAICESPSELVGRKRIIPTAEQTVPILAKSPGWQVQTRSKRLDSQTILPAKIACYGFGLE